jgi:capsular polysaccharide biosynthesis protein
MDSVPTVGTGEHADQEERTLFDPEAYAGAVASDAEPRDVNEMLFADPQMDVVGFAASIFGDPDDAPSQASERPQVPTTRGYLPVVTRRTDPHPARAGGSDEGLYVAPGRSALVHWRLVALLCGVGLVVGVLYGFVRHPTYTSTADLYVGKTLSLSNTAAIAGLSSAASQIAEDYAQLISTAPVTAGAEKLLHRSSLGGSLSASVITNTPEILVTASGHSAALAVALAAAGAASLRSDVTTLNADNASTVNSLAQTYAADEAAIANEQTRLASLQSQASANGGGSAALQSQIAQLERTISLETLQAQTVESQYSDQVSPYSSEEQVLQTLGPPRSATSDRSRAMEIGGVGGLFIGLLLGVGIASYEDLVGDWRLRRRRA